LRRLPEALREAGIIFLITRGALFLLAPLAYVTLPRIDPMGLDVPPQVDLKLTETFTGLPHYLFDIWAKWDSVWYLQIAQHGYAADNSSTAFFPLYPLLIAVFKPLFFGNGVLAGMFISLVCCLAAFYFFYLLVETDFGSDTARRSVFYMAIFPTSFYLQTIYSESLFLMLTIGCIYAARRNEYVLAGIAGALATLTRSAGLLLLVPLVIMYLRDREWDWRAVRWDALYLLMLPLGLMVWMLYLDIRFNDPWLFSEAQSYWLREFVDPFRGLYRGFIAARDGFNTVIITPDKSFWPVVDRDPRLWATYDVMNFGFAVACISLAIASFRRLPLAYASYALVVLLLPLCYPSAMVPLLSMPRFALAAFPIFILLALWAKERRWVDQLVVVSFLVMLGFLFAKFLVWTWVA